MISKKENTYNIYVEDDNGNSIATDTISDKNSNITLRIYFEGLSAGNRSISLYLSKDNIKSLSKMLDEVVKYFD